MASARSWIQVKPWGFGVKFWQLLIKLRDRDLRLNAGELVVIPHGVEHLPIAEEEAQVLLLEPDSTLNTGNVQHEKTLTSLERV